MGRDEVAAFADDTHLALPAAADEIDRAGSSATFAILRAVAAMARISKRQQAELGVALLRAGLVLEPRLQQTALQQLCDIAAIEDVIPLTDGGVLLSVTAAGMEWALR